VGGRSATDWVLNRALFERAADLRSDLTVRNDGIIHSAWIQYPRRLRRSKEACSPFRKLQFATQARRTRTPERRRGLV
jgi:hypothetical protein